MNWVEENYEKMGRKLDVYSDVWVTMTYGDTEFYEVFLDKKDAILVAHDINESRKDMIFHNPKSRKCEVKSLADAIDWIKESIEDERDFNDYISNV